MPRDLSDEVYPLNHTMVQFNDVDILHSTVILPKVMSPDLAYGVHPLTNIVVEFDDVDVLHSTIVEWYGLIDQHHLLDRNSSILFCINETDPPLFEGDKVTYSTTRHYILRDGFILINGLVRGETRSENCHFYPQINNIVIPQSMFEVYQQRYSRRQMLSRSEM